MNRFSACIPLDEGADARRTLEDLHANIVLPQMRAVTADIYLAFVKMEKVLSLFIMAALHLLAVRIPSGCEK
eukprot:CAMPEP_0198733726 /NCGR_PEP_ID=MMETSP1475-20131203/47912_1 /TAXON_ID= ORGANISM="Unidentified sp., Strain CCMP1999" /NCGR_SAMPLE_ID=MMETSP1475 /ASSEMBLY_ACC=CAM_ASM_001111 /LENGTH=71 /DNA_ID=CAMNT_0044497071 /DNA_START=67 /DNA_END=282 /DNA_ORIENTATION=+